MSINLRNTIRLTNSAFKFVRALNTSSNPLRQEPSQLSNTKEKWDLLCAVCLERKPIITKELNELEKKIQDLLFTIEIENSLKSDHELRCIADKVRIEKMKDGTLNLDMIDDALQQSGQDFVDAGLTELKKFTPASRVTKADKENNKKSLQRKLDGHLVLLLNEKLGDTSHWIMPYTKRQDGETMRQTAERILNDKFGEDISGKFYSNAPCGFYKYKYPKTLQSESGSLGAKIFFYKAQYVKGDIENKKEDYIWATREELSTLLHEEYNKKVGLFLINE